MAETKSANRKPSGRVLIAAVAVVVLAGIYLGGILFLPAVIRSGYQGKNCGLALTADNIYASIYPAGLRDKSLDPSVAECAVYDAGLSSEEQKAWQDAYNAYKTYAQVYPNGSFATEVHQHSAVTLISLARQQQSQKQYGQAVGNIKLILSNYNDTNSATDAVALMPELYTAWGTDLRKNGDFAGSESALKEFGSWAHNANQTETATAAQSELAQTYLAWGLSLQAQKKFEDAKARFDQAISTDPTPLADSGSASQAKANQLKLYGEWGDYLADQKDFPGAISEYETALSLSTTDGQPAAKDAIANGYVKWAASLSDSQDFLGALKQVDIASEKAASDATRKAVEASKTATYLAFSESSGTQAMDAIQNALNLICDRKENPELPIFGLEAGKVRAGIYGVEASLPEDLAASTPGAMHYVVCVEEVTKILQSQTHSTHVCDFSQPAHPVCKDTGTQTFVRTQYVWNVVLKETKTYTVVDQTSIPGALPDEWDPVDLSRGWVTSVHGGSPDIFDLVTWLRTIIK